MKEPDPDGLIFRADPQQRPHFFSEESNADRMLAMFSALTAEVSVLRARLDTHERLAAQHGLFTRVAVDAYEPTAEVLAARQADTQALIATVFRPLTDELQALSNDTATQRALVEDIAARNRKSQP
jgi:acyl-CoA hydrolase